MLFVASLLALAPTFKLTAAPFAFGAWVLMLVVWTRSLEGPGPARWRATHSHRNAE